ncbi:MAG: DUF2079 domain-containing protein [Chloroflexaceae bacterium]|nr:DUF2079 domain-containing protein [Chloroflexaceae bacterium]
MDIDTRSTHTNRWHISATTAQRVVLVLVILYIVLFSLASAAKYWWFGQGHDLSLHHQAIWNTIHGRVFAVTGFVTPTRLFGYDPYLIELLVVPIYALAPSVHTLFVLQSIALAMGAPAVWHIGRQVGLPAGLALLMVILYLAYPTVQYTNLDAFRERSFGLCFFLWAMWAFYQRRWRWFLLCFGLLMICRLEAALFASFFGVYAFLKGYPWRYRIVPLVLGLGYFFVGNFVLVPLLNQGEPVSYVYDYFQPLGHSMSEVITTAITRPRYTFEQTFTWAKVHYLCLLLLPLAGLPLLGPRELVFALPLVAINLLATKPQLSDVRYWYSTLIVGALMIAAINGLHWLRQRWALTHRQPWLLVMPLLGCMLLSQWLPRNPVISLVLYHEPPARVAAAQQLLAIIPPDARVAATSRLAPHLVRPFIYYYPLADTVVLPTLDYIAVDTTADWMSDRSSRQQFHALRQSDQWQLIFEQQGFQLFQRQPANRPP